MNELTQNIVEAICQEHLSESEAALVFELTEEEINKHMHLAMLQTGYSRKDLWKCLGVPDITAFHAKPMPKPTQVQTIMMRGAKAQAERLRRP